MEKVKKFLEEIEVKKTNFGVKKIHHYISGKDPKRYKA